MKQQDTSTSICEKAIGTGYGPGRMPVMGAVSADSSPAHDVENPSNAGRKQSAFFACMRSPQALLQRLELQEREHHVCKDCPGQLWTL